MPISARSSGRAVSKCAFSCSSDSSLAAKAAQRSASKEILTTRLREIRRMGSTFFRVDRDQAMSRLPFLVGKFPVGNIQKVMIIERSLFVVMQVIISGCAKKITYWRQVGVQDAAPVERANRQLVILVLARRERQIDVDIG